ncbi:uncharacterized protein METZ01_LOCUS72812, partial [marine metagenome]
MSFASFYKVMMRWIISLFLLTITVRAGTPEA